MSTTDVTEGAVASTHGNESGLDENVAGALSYLPGAITGVIFLVIDKENRSCDTTPHRASSSR